MANARRGKRRRILITGCSGGGKSSLLAEMDARGWATVPEPGRRVIATERENGGRGLPWCDLDRFLALCAALAEQDWDRAGPGVTLFDRGLIDAALAMRRQTPGVDTDPILSPRPYDPCVILVPPWPDLFHGDADRRHDMAAAVKEYEDIRAGLGTLGYAVRELARDTIKARADWLESRLRNS